jgi:O-antigen/teichoic acid export membrane protein
MTENITESERPPLVLGQVVRGGFWSFASAAVLYSLVLLRSIVLMKLLLPRDFGLWTDVVVIMLGLRTFSDLGVDKAAVQARDGARPDALDVTWTLLAGRGLLLGAAMFLAAPFVAKFYEVPELETFFHIVAAVFVLEGVSSVGVIRLTRALEFKRLFVIQQGANVVGFATAIGSALYFRSVEALVVAEVVRAGFYLALSYAVAPATPRVFFAASAMRKLWGYSKHVYANTVLGYALSQGPFLVLARLWLGEVGTLGIFRQAFMFASIPALGVSDVVGRVMFPVISRLSERPERVRNIYLSVLRMSALVVVPISTALIFLAPGIAAYGGARWESLSAPLMIMSGGMMFYCLAAAAGPLFMGAGRPGYLTATTCVNLAVLACALMPLSSRWSLAGAGLAIAAAQVPAWAVTVWLTSRLTGLSPVKLLAAQASGLLPGGAVAGVMGATWWLMGAADTPAYVIVATALGAAAALAVILVVERRNWQEALRSLREERDLRMSRE